jgi:hypothetical protein
MAGTVAALPAGSRITDYMRFGRDRQVLSRGEVARGFESDRPRKYASTRFAGACGETAGDPTGAREFQSRPNRSTRREAQNEQTTIDDLVKGAYSPDLFQCAGEDL